MSQVGVVGVMGTVLVLGSLNVDLVVRAPRLPGPGETVCGTSLERRPGGKGANQASAAAQAGVSTQLIGCVGDDADGVTYLHGLAERGVDVSRVRVVPGITTGHAVVTVDDRGENSIVILPGANEQAGEPELGRLSTVAGDVLLLQLEVPMDVVRRAALAGRAAGCTVLLNPSPYQHLPPELVRACDALVVNAAEADLLVGDGYDLSRAVVTRGADGASWGGLQVRAERVDVVDSTGAGDAFVGALAAALALGCSRQEALASASKAGARAVQHDGSQPWSF